MKMAPVRYEGIALDGGLDIVTPTLNLKPGVARASINFEASMTGGYARVAGFERLDGRPAPSTADYRILNVIGAALPVN